MIRVDKSVKLIKNSDERVLCDLVIGKKYYFSKGSNKAEECTLAEIYMQGDIKKISVDTKDGSYVLYADEIGYTPEHAVNNGLL